MMNTCCISVLLSAAMAERNTQIPPETPLPSCPERSIGLSLPVPINARLDLLVELAEQAGERTSRKEIVAACILGSPDTADELVRWLRIYRRSPADGGLDTGATARRQPHRKRTSSLPEPPRPDDRERWPPSGLARILNARRARPRP